MADTEKRHQEFENGKMRLANTRTHRAGGAIHLIYPAPLPGGPKPWCRPAYANLTNYAQGVPDDHPVTCLLCVNLQQAEIDAANAKHRKEDA